MKSMEEELQRLFSLDVVGLIVFFYSEITVKIVIPYSGL
jgi:hypothetical protein